MQLHVARAHTIEAWVREPGTLLPTSFSEMAQHGNAPTERMNSGTKHAAQAHNKLLQVPRGLAVTSRAVQSQATHSAGLLKTGDSFHQLLHACGRACFAWTTHHRRGCEVEHDRYLAALYPIWQDASSASVQHQDGRMDEFNTAERRSKIKRSHTPFGHKRANAATSIDVGHQKSCTVSLRTSAIATDLHHDD